MERLTSGETKEKIYERLDRAKHLPNVEMEKEKFLAIYEKLLSFEDLMQKYNIEDLEQLDIILFVLSGETKYRLKEIKQENKALKDRWQKLKEWLEDRRDENGCKYFDDQMIEDVDVLEKIQELEKE